MSGCSDLETSCVRCHDVNMLEIGFLFFNLDINIVRIMNTQYLEEELMQYHHHIVGSWLCIEIDVIIEEA